MVECMVFIFYNFMHYNWSFDHWLFWFSIIFAIIYLLAMLYMWVVDITVPMKDDSVLDSAEYKNKWHFVYTGL